MIVTVDTNVLVQALSNNKGASYKILESIFLQKLILSLSIPVLFEYQDVLNRPDISRRLFLSPDKVKVILKFIISISEKHDIYYLLRPNLRDEKDNLFVELAFKSNSNYLITNNIKDFKLFNDLKIDSFELVTPSEFLVKWRKFNNE